MSDRDYMRGYHHGVVHAIDIVWNHASEDERKRLKSFEESVEAQRNQVCMQDREYDRETN